jgi:hypothetical protein
LTCGSHQILLTFFPVPKFRVSKVGGARCHVHLGLAEKKERKAGKGEEKRKVSKD